MSTQIFPLSAPTAPAGAPAAHMGFDFGFASKFERDDVWGSPELTYESLLGSTGLEHLLGRENHVQLELGAYNEDGQSEPPSPTYGPPAPADLTKEEWWQHCFLIRAYAPRHFAIWDRYARSVACCPGMPTHEFVARNAHAQDELRALLEELCQAENRAAPAVQKPIEVCAAASDNGGSQISATPPLGTKLTRKGSDSSLDIFETPPQALPAPRPAQMVAAHPAQAPQAGHAAAASQSTRAAAANSGAAIPSAIPTGPANAPSASGPTSAAQTINPALISGPIAPSTVLAPVVPSGSAGPAPTVHPTKKDWHYQEATMVLDWAAPALHAAFNTAQAALGASCSAGATRTANRSGNRVHPYARGSSSTQAQR